MQNRWKRECESWFYSLGAFFWECFCLFSCFVSIKYLYVSPKLRSFQIYKIHDHALKQSKLLYGITFYKLWYFWKKAFLEKVYVENLTGMVFMLPKFNRFFNLLCCQALWFPWKRVFQIFEAMHELVWVVQQTNRTFSVWPTSFITPSDVNYECFSRKHLEIPLLYLIHHSKEVIQRLQARLYNFPCWIVGGNPLAVLEKNQHFKDRLDLAKLTTSQLLESIS